MKIIMMFFALMLNCVMGGSLAAMVGISPEIGAVSLNAVALAVPAIFPGGSAMGGVLTEVWTGELVKSLRGFLDATWLSGITDNSAIVNNDVIHLVDAGVDPDVLVNNTTYPIAVQSLDDSDISISLDKFQTKVTPITDDELYALSYDKMARVKDSHAAAIANAKFGKAIHAICPAKNAAGTPCIATTGANEGERKRITRADIISLKAAFDKLKVPTEGRRLVLCTDHVNDLLLEDQKFADQYYNYTTGKIANLYGFQVYEYGNCPTATTAGVKNALGAAGNQCSVAFYAPRIFLATGSTTMYYKEARTNPEYQRNEINFRHYFIAMPKKQEAIGMIYSAAKATA